MTDVDELGSPGYVARIKSKWASKPAAMIVIEYYGTGDPFFGGGADDRILGENGSILPHASNEKSAIFATIEEAEAAALRIPNRRRNSRLGVAPTWL